jgi:Xaa-Pro aminopeptidase
MCTVSHDLVRRRRTAFFDGMAKAMTNGSAEAGAVAVISAAPVYVRNNDVDHEYRQDSDFFYLTGFEEPESVLVLDLKGRKTILFVRPRDPEREVWDGPRAGVDGAKSVYGADEAFTVAELPEQLPKLLGGHRRLYYHLGADRDFDAKILEMIERIRTRVRTGVIAPSEIVDPGQIVHELRLYKQAEDLDTMRQAAGITREAHLLAMSGTKPGMHEYEVEAILLDTFRRHGSDRPAYGSIVGSGPNACILHYRANNRKMGPGELLLIDAGCEYGYFASDVTRTFPVSGTFSREQQAIYELVLEAQLAGIEATRAGQTLDAIHAKSVDVITRGLVRLGLLAGDPEKLIESEAYKPFFMHRTSHWLGMDVHDVGAYFVDGKARVLEPGMVLTVEPGIYIAKDYDKVPAEWRGIGVRIEDDVLVTSGDPEVLTAGIPKTVEEVVRACTS